MVCLIPGQCFSVSGRDGIRLPDAKLWFSNGGTRLALAEFYGDKLVAVKGWAKLQSQILEKWSVVHGHNDLSAVTLGNCSQQCSKLSYVHFVHRLDWVVEN